MKANINNQYVLDGAYLNEVRPDITYFVVPKGECDRELIEAVYDGSVKKMADLCGNKWLVTVDSGLIKWED